MIKSSNDGEDYIKIVIGSSREFLKGVNVVKIIINSLISKDNNYNGGLIAIVAENVEII